MTYEELRKANEAIHLVDIKGKMYAPVSERVKAFRTVFPNGSIHTEIVSNENGVCVVKASVYGNERFVEYEGYGNSFDYKGLLATGYAYEREGGSYINKTSYIENCETSAVGRALGFAGFGIDTDVASAEEVTNADLNNDAKQKISDPTRRAIIARCMEDEVPLQTVLKCAKISDLSDMTNEQHARLMDKWELIKAAVKGGKE